MPPVSFRSAKMRPSRLVTSRAISAWIAWDVFFSCGPSVSSTGRARQIFSFYFEQFPAQFLETMKGIYFDLWSN
jgi:hypothetical protein